MLLLLAFALGVLAGLRSMTPLAVVAWASRLGRLHLDPTPLAFRGSGLAAWFSAAAARGELVADKLPFTPNRTAVGPFVARLLTGALSGGAVAAGGRGAAPRRVRGAGSGRPPTAHAREAQCRVLSAQFPARSAAPAPAPGWCERWGHRTG